MTKGISTSKWHENNVNEKRHMHIPYLLDIYIEVSIDKMWCQRFALKYYSHTQKYLEEEMCKTDKMLIIIE